MATQIDRIVEAAKSNEWSLVTPLTPERLTYRRVTMGAIEVHQTLSVSLTNGARPRVHHAWLVTHTDYPTGPVRDERTDAVDRIVDMLREEA